MTGAAALAIGRWSGNHNLNRGVERKFFLRQMTESVSLCVRMKSCLHFSNLNRPSAVRSNCLDRPTRFFASWPPLNGSESGGDFPPLGSSSLPDPRIAESMWRGRTVNPLIQMTRILLLLITLFAQRPRAVNRAPDGEEEQNGTTNVGFLASQRRVYSLDG
jgi:hypothetical protein